MNNLNFFRDPLSLRKFTPMFPNLIILNTAPIVGKVRELAKGLGDYNEIADDLTQELVECVLEDKTAMHQVCTLAHDIRNGTFLYCHNEIDPSYAYPVLELGKEIYTQLKEIKAYDVTGTLPYHFHLPDLHENVDDVMLTRTYFLPHQHVHPNDTPEYPQGIGEKISIPARPHHP